MTVNPDRLADLEQERAFLLRSLADLEREHEAGDIDDVDYEALRDSYTVRAAATLRAIDDGKAALLARPKVNWRRRAVVGVACLVAVGGMSWALSAWSAERTPGQTITGVDPRDEHQVLMAQAREAMFSDPGAAAALFGDAVKEQPDDVEALTYFAWTIALDARRRADELGDAVVSERLGQSRELLLAATDRDPSYSDPKCFLGILHFRFLGDAAAAKPWVDACLGSNPPAMVRGMVEGLAAEVDDALAAGGAPGGATSTTAP